MQERLDEQALQLRRKEEAEAARRSQAQRQQQECAPEQGVHVNRLGCHISYPCTLARYTRWLAW